MLTNASKSLVLSEGRNIWAVCVCVCVCKLNFMHTVSWDSVAIPEAVLQSPSRNEGLIPLPAGRVVG